MKSLTIVTFCHYNEATKTIKALSDGWQCFLPIPVEPFGRKYGVRSCAVCLKKKLY